jgi:formylglycine-generating enzyme required for sulfatase activity
MKNNKNRVFSIGILVIIMTILSCTLPYKIVPNITETATNPPTITPIPSSTPQAQNITNQTTPIPDKAEVYIEALPAAGSVLTWIDYSNFVYIPSGKYLQGKDSTNQANFSPLHELTLDGFWIQQSEVTNQQYAQCVADGKCSPPIQDPEVPYWYENPYEGNQPIVGVTWFQAREYCSYIQARLPTEAEWEAAARGENGKLFPWGGDKPNCNYLNYNGCTEPSKPDVIRSYPFGASDFRVYDMAGNVFEWVDDWYSKDYYSASPSSNPTGPLDGRKRVYRGGSYRSGSEELGSFLRFSTEPENQFSDLGFRCVLQKEEVTETNQSIGRPCQIIGMNDPLQIPPTSTPFPCPVASVTGFCQLLGGKASYGVEINQSGCQNNLLHSMTANSQPLSCSVTELSDGGNKYRCTFPGMAQGMNVYISYSHSFALPNVEISCPLGYQLDQNSKLCELEHSKLPNPPCPRGYLDVADYGCLPIYDSNFESCPIGFYSVETNSQIVCIPSNHCLLSSMQNSCNNIICASGQRFNSELNCCDSAFSPKKICPSNLLYNTDQNVCLGPEVYPERWDFVELTIPKCPTLTPTASPTERKPKDCSIYKDGDTCLANGCNWTIGWIRCYE